MNTTTFAAPKLQIYVGTTFFKFRASKRGLIGPGFSLVDYMRSTLMEREWVPRFKKYVTTYTYSLYEESTGMAVLPRYALDSFLLYISHLPYEIIDIDPVKPKKTKFKLKPKIVPRPEQEELIEFLNNNNNFLPVSASCGRGKEHPIDTPIRVPNGWKPIGELQIGDPVFTQDGTITEVTAIYPQGVKPLYRVTFEDGRWVDCGGPHLWKVFVLDTNSSIDPYKQRVLTTEQLRQHLAIPANAKRTYIPLPEPLNDPDVDLPIDPYFLGVILGDGSLTQGFVSIATDKEILDRIHERNPEISFYARHHPDDCSYYYEARMRVQGKGRETISILDKLGLLGRYAWNKFIPKEYLTASHQQRMDLLRGLMDTDGAVSDPKKSHGRNGTPIFNGALEFSTSSEQLAYDFQELLRSVGGKTRLTTRIPHFTHAGERKAGRLSYRFRVRVKSPNSVFYLERKRRWCTETTQYSKRWKLRVQSVEPIPVKKECVCIAVKHPSHLYITKDYIVTHNTFCSIYAVQKNSTPAMVVVSGLGEQWYKEFHHFLKLSSDDVYMVQGFDTLKLLWEGIRRGYKPKVLIFSTRTLVLYACNPIPPYSELPSYPELQQKLGIGVKITDECHLNFHANVLIDLMSNVQKNIYLSATYSRSSVMGNKIFNTVYPRDMVYGEAIAHKYTVVHMIRYHLDIPSDEHDRFKVPKGYLHALYEKYLMRRKKYYTTFMEKVLLPCLRMYYLNCRKEKQKALVLCQTKDFVITVQETIRQEIKFLKVAAFLSKDPKYGKVENFEADIIVSTLKSSGTGRDIKGLKTCINTVSFASAPLAAQVMGRPREIKGEDTIYIDLWNGEVPTHYQHQRRRIEAYRPRAKSIDETTIN